jgi:hypothetical protein
MSGAPIPVRRELARLLQRMRSMTDPAARGGCALDDDVKAAVRPYVSTWVVPYLEAVVRWAIGQSSVRDEWALVDGAADPLRCLTCKRGLGVGAIAAGGVCDVCTGKRTLVPSADAAARLRSWQLSNTEQTGDPMTYRRQGYTYRMAVTGEHEDDAGSIVGSVVRVHSDGHTTHSNTFRITSTGQVPHAPSHLKQLRWRE